MTEGVAHFTDGTEKVFCLAYEAFMSMFRTATLDTKKIEWIETYSAKGPYRTQFV